MATSKRSRRVSSTPPDPVPFLQILDEGTADPITVAKAYQHVLAEWSAAGGETPIEIVAERPEPEPHNSPGARMIRLHREAIFKNTKEEL